MDRHHADRLAESHDSGNEISESSSHLERSYMITQATRVRELMEARSRHFPSDMFGEAAWEIILTLYVSEQPHMSAMALSELAGIPPAALHRWLTYLEVQMLVTTTFVSSDLNSRMLQLTESGREAMDQYLVQVARAFPASA